MEVELGFAELPGDPALLRAIVEHGGVGFEAQTRRQRIGYLGAQCDLASPDFYGSRNITEDILSGFLIERRIVDQVGNVSREARQFPSETGGGSSPMTATRCIDTPA